MQAVLSCIVSAHYGRLCQRRNRHPNGQPGLLCEKRSLLQSLTCTEAHWNPCMLRAGCCCCRSEARPGGLGPAPDTPDTRVPIRDATAAAGRLAAAQGPQLGHHLCHPQGAGHLAVTEVLDVYHRPVCPKTPCMLDVSAAADERFMRGSSDVSMIVFGVASKSLNSRACNTS